MHVVAMQALAMISHEHEDVLYDLYERTTGRHGATRHNSVDIQRELRDQLFAARLPVDYLRALFALRRQKATREHYVRWLRDARAAIAAHPKWMQNERVALVATEMARRRIGELRYA